MSYIEDLALIYVKKNSNQGDTPDRLLSLYFEAYQKLEPTATIIIAKVEDLALIYVEKNSNQGNTPDDLLNMYLKSYKDIYKRNEEYNSKKLFSFN